MPTVPEHDHERRRSDAGQLRRDVDAFHAALHDAREDRESNTDVLRAAVAQLAITARADGLRPERLLTIIKGAMKRDSLDHLSGWWRNMLTDRVVRWSIETYYGQPPGVP